MKSHENNEDVHRCGQCDKTFLRKDNLMRHMKIHTPDNDPCEEEAAALNGTVLKKIIHVRQAEKHDVITALNSHQEKVINILKNSKKKFHGIKWHIIVKIRFVRMKDDQPEYTMAYFNGACQKITLDDEIQSGIEKSHMKIVNSFVEFQRNGSSWTLDSVEQIHLKIVEYKPVQGSSYIQTPKSIASSLSIINPKNKDDKCFMWAILAGVYPVKKNANRIDKYKDHTEKLNFAGIKFPVKLNEIHKFEKLNQISVSVFGYEKEVYPLRQTQCQFATHVNLLLLDNGTKQHYCLIKNLNRFLSHTKKQKTTTYFCQYCLQGFTSSKILNDHLEYCSKHAPLKVTLPDEDEKWLTFRHFARKLRVPYVIYGDFESLQSKLKPHDKSSGTHKTRKHVASGFTYKIVSATTDENFPCVTYRGSNTPDVFVQQMLEVETMLMKKLETNIPMDFSKEDDQQFKDANECHICKLPLNNDRVRDHDHTTGNYRGAAHNSCNLHFKNRPWIPVFFHNLRGYDSHIIMEAIGKQKRRRISCIPNNLEKYISFSLGNIVFLDSLQFLNASLDQLVANLRVDGQNKFPHTFNYMRVKYPDIPLNAVDLLLKKGVYPYDYMDSEEKFHETCLPPREAFYNTLNEQDLSEEEYRHAQMVWQTFGMKNLGDYHNLYMETDVHLLADVFENFRDLCMAYYELDPCHYYTGPGLAWQAALKMTEVKLELLTDLDMHLFIEEGQRGGVAMISHRHAQANNPYLPNYDDSVPNSYIMYLDANNLYGWAMSQPLPTHGFRWLTDEEITNLDISAIPDDSTEGYILEVDLTYPTELHDDHNDYPLAPETFNIEQHMLSDYARRIQEELHLPKSTCTKLVPNLQNKTKYVVHYRNLKLYQALGLQLTKIHRVLVFEQSPWLKAYIEFNTSKRKTAKSDFEKDFFKLMNNAVFGKTMENLRKHANVKLVSMKKKMLKLAAKPNFKTFKIFNENLVAVEMQKVNILLNRPIYVGFTILDLSKFLMYDFFYNELKCMYGANVKLLFTDTDSLCVLVNTEDMYEDMKLMSHLFDFSDYPVSHKCYSTTNKKKIGVFKDECNSIPPSSYVGLRPKMYSIRYDESEKKAAKGVQKYVIKAKLRHNDYEECLFSNKSQHHTMNMIRSDHHTLYTINQRKRTLCPFDDKRYLMEDGVASLAYGHYNICT